MFNGYVFTKDTINADFLICFKSTLDAVSFAEKLQTVTRIDLKSKEESISIYRDAKGEVRYGTKD